MKVSIKGKPYEVKFKDDTFIFGDRAYCGLCDYEKQEITISTKYKNDTPKNIYHELTHAYLKESGLTNYAHDEVLVEWIAQNIEDIIQSGKEILKKVKREKI